MQNGIVFHCYLLAYHCYANFVVAEICSLCASQYILLFLYSEMSQRIHCFDFR